MAEAELQQIGPYQVTGLLRVSPTSNFYQSKQRKKDILIQRLNIPLATSEDKERFLSRAKQLKKLKHRNIINILDANFDGDHGYLVMEYTTGETLHQRLAPGVRMPPDEAKRYLSPIAGALHYAHLSNTLHSNLHPANLLVSNHNDILLTNFSLTPPSSVSPFLDEEAFAIPYMAPEHLRGQPTAASDQYSLAAIGYELLCGQRPYEATERELLLLQQEKATFLPPSSLNEAISPAVERVIMRALAHDPAERFPHIQAFTDYYLSALMGFPVRTTQSRTSRPTKPVTPASTQSNRSHQQNEPALVNGRTATNQPIEEDANQPSSHPTDTGQSAASTPTSQEQGTTPQEEQNIHEYEKILLPTNQSQQAAEEPEKAALTSTASAEEDGSTPATSTPQSEIDLWPDDLLLSDQDLSSTVTADLWEGGILSQRLPGYEERPAQIEMASLVSRAITQYVPAIIEAGTGTGKALDVDTSIPTPTGWKRMGDLVTGDFVFDEKGHPTCVIAAFDVMYDHKCYEVIFSDGSSLIADAKHEWISYTYSHSALLTSVRSCLATDSDEQCRDSQEHTLVTTEQMATTLTSSPSVQASHAIIIAGALTLPEADLPIDSYLLGVRLGVSSSRSNQMRDRHIPMIYLRASERQRRALLAGILDTNGTINHCGTAEFTTTSPQLAQDVYELICSLGFRPTSHKEHARDKGKDYSPEWTIAFTTDQQIFRLERKVAAHKERLHNYSPEHNRFRHVVEVQEVPSCPVRCIQVESPSHLYLAGRSMIPTHNSLAYLVPVVRSGQVAIISTANKALQEQLFYKDIPFVQKHIKAFDAALVKGINNYICLNRVESERTGLQFYVRNREFMRLLDIINYPPSAFNGDFETLGFQLPVDIRSKVATDSDQCAWSKCDHFGGCYVRKMRERAARAKVIVVNHTLLLLDAAIGGYLLPERDVIILDEAHHLEEEATRAFTITVGPAQIQTLLAQRLLRDHSQLNLQDAVMRAAQDTWIHLQQIADPVNKVRVNLESPLEEGLRLASLIDDLADSLRKQRPNDLEEKEDQLYDKLLKRTQNLAENIRTVFSVSDPNKFVYYAERVEGSISRGFVLQASAAPLDVTALLKERLFGQYNVICTSATLATTGPNPVQPEDKGANFAYFRRRTGLDPLERSDVLECILPLAFDYEENALLYLPRDLPAPTFGNGSDDYMKAIAREMYKLVKLSRGRAFLLFSSKRMLDRAYELMSPHLLYPLLKQGDMTRLELTQRFRQEEGAVLFGLKSFWEGVDIAGEALSMVVIDKLPFDPPDDPVHEARVAQMKAAGENWFGTYVLPQAVLRLKQGLGRLLRTREDRGVMAILDTRLHTKGYGKLVLNALPPARRTTSLRDVEQFFA